jgi:uncharacterized cofD-like protein
VPVLSPSSSAKVSPATAARRVVAIGGGTGLSTLLRGLKRHVLPHPGSAPLFPSTVDPEPECPPVCISDLAAIVTVTDDGGSSGRLRKDFKMLPPGDLRNCMVALSEDEHLISQLFRHRFRNGGELEGHNFGNLFVAALAEMTGDFAHAVRLAAEVLATRGHIYPVTASNVTLAARMSDGSVVQGETNITASNLVIQELMLEPPNVQPLPEALAAIESADLITLGPGSLFTSIITNLLVPGIPEALAQARGTRVYVANLMTQANESLHLTASQHIERIYAHARAPIFDYALINTAPVPEAARERYAAEHAEVIEADIDKIEAMGIRCITGDFAEVEDVVRHNPDRVAEALLELPIGHE